MLHATSYIAPHSLLLEIIILRKIVFRFSYKFCFSVVHNVLMLSCYVEVNTANCPISCLGQGHRFPSVTSINYEYNEISVCHCSYFTSYSHYSIL